MDPKFAGNPLSAIQFGRSDIDQMPDTPHRGGRHRRAQSETFFRFPDDILFDDVLADFNLEGPSLSSDDANPSASAAFMAVDSAAGAELSKEGPAGLSPHFRSLSVGDDFFQGLDFIPGGDSEKTYGRPPVGSQQNRHHRRHSSSMDGSTSSFEAESTSMGLDGIRKSMAPDELAELSMVDPKRAKRILANRLSAAKSKERKVRYTNELERKVQTLQIEATTLSSQIIQLQKDASGLTAENRELKLRLQAMENQANLRQALQETLRDEIQQLKITISQLCAVNGNPFYKGLSPQMSSLQIFQQHPTTGDNHTQQPSHQQQQQQQQLHVSTNYK